MQTTMANFEDRFFEELSKRFDRFERKLDKNTALTQTVANDTQHLDKRVTTLEKRRTFLSNIGDKRLIMLFFVALTVFLFIIANITKTELPKWLG